MYFCMLLSFVSVSLAFAILFYCHWLSRKSHLICSPWSWSPFLSYSYWKFYFAYFFFVLHFQPIFHVCVCVWRARSFVRLFFSLCSMVAHLFWCTTHKLTTFTSLFMFTLCTSQIWCSFHSTNAKKIQKEKMNAEREIHIQTTITTTKNCIVKYQQQQQQ